MNLKLINKHPSLASRLNLSGLGFIILLILISCTKNVSAQENNKDVPISGGYSAERDVTQEDLELFRNTYKGEIPLTPIRVSTQVVAGLKYKFICKDDNDNRYQVIIYKKLSGEAEVMSVISLSANTQRSFMVKNGDIELPGTLCTGGDMNTPIIVLVHGSGPNDRDETIGPNKMFKQLAEQLQKKGVSTLRYDKRTMLYKGGADTITFNEETVDDAVMAAIQLHELGYKHIYVAGHSLGGHCIPLIAEGCGKMIDGVIIMSGNISTLEVAIKTQLNYIGKLQGATDAQIQAGINQMLSALPEKYQEFDKNYSPMTVAKKVVSDNPKLKWMVIGGGHDYQVTSTDFSMWQMCLGNKATYYWGENLDHIFRNLPAMATPQDYMKEGNIDTEVVNKIAKFAVDR